MSIDWTKPLYDRHGREWYALRNLDGSVFVLGDCRYIVSGNDQEPVVCWSSGQLPGSSVGALSNAKPHPDWEHYIDAMTEGVPGNFRVRFGYRNGHPFAEVVQ